MIAGTRVGHRALGTLGITSAVVVWTLGCNAILGIEEGKLVSADAGAGGSGARADGSAAGGDTTGSTGGSSDGSAGGGTATGGSSGDGGAAGGTGGKGTGGAATGGSTGTGGAGTGGAGTGGVPNGVAGEVRCGTSSCKLSAGQVCCVATATGDAHCSTSCDSSTQQKFACDGAEDCQTTNPKCCYPNGGTTAACAGACQGRVFCGADADCAPGQYCAPGTGPLATVAICTDAPKKDTVWCSGALCDVTRGKTCCYSKTTKTESCVAATACAATDVSFACDGPDDCPVAGSVCCVTRTGLGLLTGGQCSTTGTCPMNAVIECGGSNGCAAGFTCCLTATTGVPACAATCTSAQTVCGTNADCAGATCTLLTDPAVGKPTGRTFCK